MFKTEKEIKSLAERLRKERPSLFSLFLIRSNRPYCSWASLVDVWTDIIAKEIPYFDKKRFRLECGYLKKPSEVRPEDYAKEEAEKEAKERKQKESAS